MDQSCRNMFNYCIDMVLCIDVSRSMEPFMCTVKEQAVKLPNELARLMCARGKNISDFRVRILTFNNGSSGDGQPVRTTDFFSLLSRRDEFSHLVNSINADGCGIESAYGLEALAYAMASKWQQPSGQQKCRQIIVVWTDASTHKLGFGKSAPNYDPKLPADFAELTNWWGDDPDSPTAKMHYSSKRLLLFAPDAKYWSTISENWDNVIPVRTVAGQGLSERDLREIVSILMDI